jgi:hypothetical protein
MLALPIALALASVSSCASNPGPTVDLNLSADTFERADRPEMTAEALDSEAAREAVEDARDAWAKDVARRFDAACRVLQRVAVADLRCRPAKAEWE